jgi:hypothetical protein
MCVACNHLILSLRGLYHNKSVSTLNQTLTSIVVAPRPTSGADTTDTGASDGDGRYYSDNLRVSFVSNPRSPTWTGRGSKSKSSGDDAYVMSDHDIGMGTFSGSKKEREGDSESREKEERVEGVEGAEGAEGEYIVGEAL